MALRAMLSRPLCLQSATISLWDSGYLCNIKLLTYDLWIEIIPEQ